MGRNERGYRKMTKKIWKYKKRQKQIGIEGMPDIGKRVDPNVA